MNSQCLYDIAYLHAKVGSVISFCCVDITVWNNWWHGPFSIEQNKSAKQMYRTEWGYISVFVLYNFLLFNKGLN